MKRKEASEPIYGTRVLFLFGGTERESSDAAVEWMQSECGENCEPDESESSGRVFESGKGHFVVWVKDPGDFSALTHEIIHTGVRAMDHIGHPIAKGTDEPLAYYCDWLTSEAIKAQ